MPDHSALGAQALLSQHTSQDDIVAGMPYANRDMSEVHDMLGPFANSLALRLPLSVDPSFCKLALKALRRAKAMVTQAFVHRVVPFAKVADALSAVHSAADHPIYQVSSGCGHHVMPVVKKADFHRSIDQLRASRVWS